MKLNIYNNISNIGQVYDTISSAYLDFAPTNRFHQIITPDGADIVLMSGVITSEGTLSINIMNGGLGLFNLPKVASISKAIHDAKGRIVWLDAMGPSINQNENLFLEEFTGLRDTDIVISPVTVPERSNLFTHLFHIEKSVFYKHERFDRIPSSVLISHDNLMPELDLIKGVMDTISELHVTKSASLQPIVAGSLSKYLSKISCEFLPYPKGIAYEASQCEFVLHTHTRVGTEMMGIEAGMAGCQPIYPDTEFYRDIFDGTGVVFYDIDNAVDSLKAIIAAGATWSDEQVEAFRTKFSAEDNLPAFWDHVYRLYAIE